MNQFIKKHCLWLLLLINSGVLAEEVIIGDMDSAVSYIPNRMNKKYSYSQQIYLQSEINTGSAVSITSLSFYWGGKNATQQNRTIVVYMNHTTKSSFIDKEDWVSTGLNEVYSGNYSVPTSAGWVEIKLKNPFLYNDISNLLISFDDNTNDANTNRYHYGTVSESNRTLYYSDDVKDFDPVNPERANAIAAYFADVKLSYSSVAGGSYIWDADGNTGGIQGGSGTWGTNSYWTNDGGSTRRGWPGAGSNATFAGSDGTYEITVNESQSVDSITFLYSGYTLQGSGGINLGSKNGMYVAPAKSAIIKTPVTGSNGLTKSGDGALILTGINSWSGGTNINSGTLQFGDGISQTLSIPGDIVCNGSLIVNSAKQLTCGSSIRGTGTFTKNGDYRLILSGNNTYTGATTINVTAVITDASPVALSGDVILRHVNALGAISSGTTVNTGAAIILGGSASDIANESIYAAEPLTLNGLGPREKGALRFGGGDNTSLSWSGPVSLATESKIAVTDVKDILTISNVISGTGKMIKDGSGILLLSEANTFTGATVVSAGELRITGSLALGSAVTVETGATISGTGTVNGPLTINGTHSPGTTGPGYFNAAGGLTYSSSATCLIEINGTSAGTNYDQIAVTGGVTLANVTLSVALGYAPDVNDMITIISNDASDVVNGTFNRLAQGFTITLTYDNTSYNFVVSYNSGTNGNDVVLTCIGETTTIADAVKITSCTFDSAAVGIRVGWNVDTTKYNGEFEIGITYSLEKPPVNMGDGEIIIGSSINGSVLLRPTPFFPDTLYYVALFIREPDKQWIGATDLMRSTVQTGAFVIADAAKIRCSFDSVAAGLHVGWNIDTAKYNDSFDIGITYSLENYPIDISNGTVIPSATFTGDTLLFPKPLFFDTVYYVSLFVRKPDGEWIGATESMRGTVRTGAFFREVINFADTSLGDTIKAFNGQVVLWDDSIPRGTIDTLEVYSFTEPRGFTVVGTSFRFVQPSPTAQLGIGIRIGTLPAGVSIYDVRIYNEKAGVFTVNYQSQVDSLKRIVYVTTTDINVPFIAMIDRVQPTVVSVNSYSSPVYPGIDLIDTVLIADNAFNVQWKHFYSRGDSALILQKSGTLSDTLATLQLVIPGASGAINDECGVRSLFVVSDGVQSDTINLSRSVYRDVSKLFTTEKEAWQPVYSTAQLINTDPDSLVIARSVGETLAYDQRYRRLFRWLETVNNSSAINKWVEYDPANAEIKSSFSMDPGKMFWLKTKDNNTINLGQGYTVSQRESFSFTLPPKQFTDFGTPFRFGIQIHDFLTASEGVASSVQIYEWVRSEATKQYSCVPFYIKSMAGKRDSLQLITFENTGAYCLYNPTEQPITLKIPSNPKFTNDSKVLAKNKSDPFWGVKVVATREKGNSLPALYYGYAPGFGKSNYPVAPSFDEVQLFLYDSTLGKRQGHYIAEDASDGIAKKLYISNTSESTEVISYRFETAGGFPESFSAYLYDTTTENYSTSGTITVEPQSTVSSWVIVGDAKWRDHFRTSVATFNYGIKRLYPNPARSIVNIRYSVGSGVQERMYITIFDLHGRTIWEKRSNALLVPGSHLLTWKGNDLSHKPVGAGMYVVQMSITDINGKIIRQFNQRFTFLP